MVSEEFPRSQTEQNIFNFSDSKGLKTKSSELDRQLFDLRSSNNIQSEANVVQK